MTDKGPQGGTAIAAVVTLREVGRRLSITADRARGAADALGIALTPVGRALVMTEADFRRLAKAVRRNKVDQPETAAAS